MAELPKTPRPVGKPEDQPPCSRVPRAQSRAHSPASRPRPGKGWAPAAPALPPLPGARRSPRGLGPRVRTSLCVLLASPVGRTPPAPHRRPFEGPRGWPLGGLARGGDLGPRTQVPCGSQLGVFRPWGLLRTPGPWAGVCALRPSGMTLGGPPPRGAQVSPAPRTALAPPPPVPGSQPWAAVWPAPTCGAALGRLDLGSRPVSVRGQRCLWGFGHGACS